MVNTPNWVSVNTQLGWPAPGVVDAPTARADTFTYPSIPIGTVAQFRDTGTTQLGVGTFIYLPGVASTTAGDWVEWIGADATTTSSNKGATTTRWAGTANTGKPLAVATAAVTATTKYGWYQLQGAAICNISGTVTTGDKVFYGGAAGQVQSTVVGGKQVLGAQASSANGVPNTTNAIYTLSYPFVQGQIT